MNRLSFAIILLLFAIETSSAQSASTTKQVQFETRDNTEVAVLGRQDPSDSWMYLFLAPIYQRIESERLEKRRRELTARMEEQRMLRLKCQQGRRDRWDEIFNEVLGRFPHPSPLLPLPARELDRVPYLRSRSFLVSEHDEESLRTWILIQAKQQGMSILRAVTYGLGTQIEISSEGTDVQYSFNGRDMTNSNSIELEIRITKHPSVPDENAERYKCEGEISLE